MPYLHFSKNQVKELLDVLEKYKEVKHTDFLSINLLKAENELKRSIRGYSYLSEDDNEFDIT